MHFHDFELVNGRTRFAFARCRCKCGNASSIGCRQQCGWHARTRNVTSSSPPRCQLRRWNTPQRSFSPQRRRQHPCRTSSRVLGVATHRIGDDWHPPASISRAAQAASVYAGWGAAESALSAREEGSNPWKESVVKGQDRHLLTHAMRCHSVGVFLRWPHHHRHHRLARRIAKVVTACVSG